MINVRIQTPEVQRLSPKITVVGVGGAGGNAVNNMISSNLEGCEFLVTNTDAQALEGSLSNNKIQLGAHVTSGLGAGAKPEIGQQAAEETLDEVMQVLEGSNMAFITAGMGGGTGTGAAPVIAKACRDSGILTVGVVTKPFHFEGTHRMKMAEAGIHEMQDYVDTLIIIPNQNLFRVANEKTTFAEAFKMADTVLQSGVRGVTDLMVMPGLINLDFADIRSAMLEMGKAMMGTGESDSERRAVEAAEAAINNPLLDDVSMKGARGVIINVTGGHDMTLFEVDEACNRIRDEVDPNANIIFGSTFDEKLDGIMRVSVVATGIDVAEMKKPVGNAGGVKVTAIGKQEEAAKPPLERAKPIAERPIAAQGQLQQPVQARAALPTHAAIQLSAASVTAVAAQKAEEPETEMFEQQEFTPVQPVQARGAVHGGSFIPPRPVMPEAEAAAAAAPAAPTGYGPRLGASPAPVAPPPASRSGLNLTPPVPGQGAAEQERKRTPSLFERITGIGKAEEPNEYQAPESPAPAPQASQGKLNIDAPSAQKPASDDELDIPAFLRRQAN